MAEKSKTTAQNGVFWHKKGPGPSPKKQQKVKKSIFHKKNGFTPFSQIEAKKGKKIQEKSRK